MLTDDLKNGHAQMTNWQLLHAYWIFSIISSKKTESFLFPFFKFIIRFRLPLNFLIKPVYKQFFCGKDLEHSIQIIRNFAKKHIFTTVHYGGEVTQKEVGFKKNFDQIMYSIEFAHTHLKIKIISCKVTSLISESILEKVQNHKALSESETETFRLLNERITAICDLATTYQIGVYWDAEVSWIQNVIDDIIIKQMQIHNGKEAYIFNTCQMYRTDKLEYLQHTYKYAKENNFVLGVKLVRGSYLQSEKAYQIKNQSKAIVYSSKKETDQAYDQAVVFCLNHLDKISVCIASHNEFSNEAATRILLEKNIDPKHPHVWFSQLYGMSEHLSTNLAELDFNVSKYTPYGKIKDSVNYLMRRAHENNETIDGVSREIAILKKEIFRRSIQTSK